MVDVIFKPDGLAALDIHLLKKDVATFLTFRYFLSDRLHSKSGLTVTATAYAIWTFARLCHIPAFRQLY